MVIISAAYKTIRISFFHIWSLSIIAIIKTATFIELNVKMNKREDIMNKREDIIMKSVMCKAGRQDVSYINFENLNQVSIPA
mgnify:CR=1 FL=1